jgi:hypothetical protein
VINTDDSGVGSLRQAIIDANASAGADNILFSIDLLDSHYNSTSGVWTIQLLTELPMLTGGYIVIDGNSQTTNIGNTNLLGPEIEINGGNILDYAFRIPTMNNQIKALIISGFEFGIQLYGTSAYNCVIQDNYIGAAYNGIDSSPNDYAIGVSGNAYNNTIRNNLISGNSIAGIVCSPANNISIYGNKIGTDISGLLPLPNPTGIILENSPNNIVGGTIASSRNLISGNTDAGIMIYDILSSGNSIVGNYIGTNTNGTDTIPNGNGIMIVSSSDNLIGGPEETAINVISGNLNCGILIDGTGANENSIQGNYIGVDATGNAPLSNHYGVIIKADADNNTVGGNSGAQRNVISANHEIGVYIEASDGNVVSGNFIGTNYLGTEAFYNDEDVLIQANGAEINTLSQNNIIGGNTEGERNIISGNRVYGAIYYGQVSNNNIAGNYIGTDVSGSYAIPNATGICVDDASNNNIMENNLLSGNISYGLFIVTTGSNSNVFRANLVGTNAAGTAAIPNDVGLLIAGGAKNNIIGGNNSADRNVFSGNNYGGIEISDNGTDYNQILGNFIGTDINGNVSLPNSFGIGISSLVTKTQIENNVVSGNSTFGIILTENADSSVIVGNYIGTGQDGNSDVGNGACGIAITAGANNNIIGAIENPNIIAYNDSVGIVIADNNTIRNRISGNSIYDNEYLGIDILPGGVNENDIDDIDIGPNLMMNFPEITSAIFDSNTGNTFIEGILDTQNPQNCEVEIFVAEPDLTFLNGEGRTYHTTVVPDAGGNWSAVISGLSEENILTSTATDSDGNTSEFSANSDIILGIYLLILNSADFSVFPNPSNGIFSIITRENSGDILEIKLFDYSGRFLKNLYSGEFVGETLEFNSAELGLNSSMYLIQIVDKSSGVNMLKLNLIK